MATVHVARVAGETPFAPGGLNPYSEDDSRFEEILMRALTLAALAAFAAVTPANAQTERLPLTSRAEAQVNGINRSLAIQQQLRTQSQQTQFEVNQLRGEIQHIRQFPSMTNPGMNPGCPPGSVGC